MLQKTFLHCLYVVLGIGFPLKSLDVKVEGFRLPKEYHAHDGDGWDEPPDSRVGWDTDYLQPSTDQSFFSIYGRHLSSKSSAQPSDSIGKIGIEFQPFICGLRPITPKARIVGGKEASLGQFPWQVQLLVKKSPKGKYRFQCGGTLVSEDLIITAAHCITSQNTETYSIILGKEKSDPDFTSCFEQRFNVKKLLVHPSYNKKNLLNDIALVWIKSKYNQTVHFTDHIQPACLPSHKKLNSVEVYKKGQHGTVSGWGLLEEKHHKGSPTLQYVSVPIVLDTNCEKAYSSLVKMNTSLQFCAGNNRGQDACAGDSGGPFVQNIDGRFVLVGVVSFGKGCGRKEFPGVYVKIMSYVPWILKQISNINNNKPVLNTKPTTTAPTTTQSVTHSTTQKPQTNTPLPSDGCRDGETCNPSVNNVNQNKVEVAGPFCAGAFKYINCKHGKKIDVVDTFFGQDSPPTHCRKSAKVGSLGSRGAAAVDKNICSLPRAKFSIKRRCQNRRACWLYHGLFTRYNKDPCPKRLKYALVKYICK